MFLGWVRPGVYTCLASDHDPLPPQQGAVVGVEGCQTVAAVGVELPQGWSAVFGLKDNPARGDRLSFVGHTAANRFGLWPAWATTGNNQQAYGSRQL